MNPLEVRQYAHTIARMSYEGVPHLLEEDIVHLVFSAVKAALKDQDDAEKCREWLDQP